MQLSNFDWPPPYHIHESRLARNIFLKITPQRGLEIVVPYRRAKPNISQLLHEKRKWIEKNYHHILAAQEILSVEALPTVITCPAILETWDVIYQFIPTKNKVALKKHPDKEGVLVVSGNTTNVQLCCLALKKFFFHLAQETLGSWLKTLSLMTGLHYDRFIIRGQTTLWGSCNTHKTISLNYKLLFLPRTLAEHVLLHELCHTQYLNHSKRFWQLLSTWDNQCEFHKKQLKKADHYLPKWVLRSK